MGLCMGGEIDTVDAMKIFLIRHGETTGDIEDRYGGSYDDHLTDRGRAQLADTAQKLKGSSIEIIFHSPLIRACESAEIIKGEIRCDLRKIDGLRERHYGVLTGLTKNEAIEKYPEVVEAHKNPMNTDPEGESFTEFDTRVIAAFKEIINEPYQMIAILAHGGSLKRILAHCGLPIPDSIGDGGVIEMEV